LGSFITRLIVIGLLAAATMIAYGGSFYGWLLPADLKKPVSIREGSQRPGSHGRPLYFLGGRTHYGGGYRGGK
jgi:hypothetical protein